MAKTTQEDRGDMTTISSATSKSKSLRATIPIGVARQFHLAEGDKLSWQIKVVDGRLGILVVPLKEGK